MRKIKTLCLGCGFRIPAERLEALPETLLCIDCAKKVVKPITANDLDLAGPDHDDERRIVSQPRGER